MKKLVSLLLVTVSIISSSFSFYSCSSTENKKQEDSKIYLTLYNYEQYLDVSAKMYGKNGRWNSLDKDYYYQYVTTSVEISSTSPLVKFYNCSINVRVLGNYYSGASTNGNYSVDETLKIQLSLGGTGSNYKDKYITFANANNIVGKGYEVVSVSGYVVVD